jgi:hypothetical protein
VECPHFAISFELRDGATTRRTPMVRPQAQDRVMPPGLRWHLAPRAEPST